MNWANPELLNGLWVVPAVVFIWFLRQKRNRRVKNKLIDSNLEDKMWKRNEKNANIRWALLLIAYIFLILAAARPRWGRELSITESKGYNVVFAFDASRSMLAEDVKPNRIEKSKNAVSYALKQLPGSRVGLVAFSGDAYILCPLTLDKNVFNMFIDMINPGMIPSHGTNMGKAIRKSKELFSDKMEGSKIIIIISDGENIRGDPRVEALEARKEGIKIFTVSAGTREGAPIPVFDSTGKFVEYMKEENGQTHISIANTDLLRAIADAGDGAFLQGEGVELGLMVKLFKNLKKGKFGTEKMEHLKEKYIFFLLGAVVFMMAGILISTGKE